MKSAPHPRYGGPGEFAPTPQSGLSGWLAELAGWVRKDPDVKWGGPLLRVASDMMVICDEQLVLRHHNRAFLKAVGYQSGRFKGNHLGEFIPSQERDAVIEAFADWRRGHAAGMRFQAPLLTSRGVRTCDFRAVRSRERNGGFVYYLVGREATEARRPGSGEGEDGSEPFFRGLPVAAWRTDGELRITQVFGSLWPELGAASEDLVGEVFGRGHDSLLPALLLGFDCSDTLSGMSLQTEVEREGDVFNVTVEPFLDAAGQIVGTVGMLRRAGVVSPQPTLRTLVPDNRLRHHTPPRAQTGGISIMTGPVPKFSGGSTRPTEIIAPVGPPRPR